MSRTVDCSLTATQSRFRFGPAAAPAAEAAPSVALKLLMLFILVLYSNIAQIYPQLNVFRPAFVVAAAATMMMFLEIRRDQTGLRIAWPQGYLIIAFLGVAVVSSFNAIYIRLAFETTFEIARIVLIYFLIENLTTNEQRLRTMMFTLVAAGLFPAIGTIVYFQRGIFIEGTRAAWVGTFKNPNEVAYALVVLVPLAVVLASTSRWMVRVALWGVIAIYILAIYLTFSRGGLLGLFGVLALLGWKQRSTLVRVMMVAALGASLVLVGLFWNRSGDFSDLRQDTTVNQRIATIKAGFAMFADHPLLGVGPGCSMVAYPLYVPPEAHCGCQDQLVIHNAPVQVLSETGLLGFVPFTGLLGLSMFQLWGIQRRTRTGAPNAINAYAVGLELALWGFLACGLSGGFSYSWYPYIVVGLTVAAKRISDSRSAEDQCPM